MSTMLLLSVNLLLAAPQQASSGPRVAGTAQRGRGAMALTGRVLDPRTLEPVAGVDIAVADAARGLIDWGERLGARSAVRTRRGRATPVRSGTAVTTADGRFRVPGLPRGQYVIVARHPTGVAVVPRFGFTSANAEAEIVLEPPIRIVARFTDLPGMSQVNRLWLSAEAVGLPRNLRFPPWVRLDADNRLDLGPLPRADRWSIVGRQFVRSHRYNAIMLNMTAEPDADGIIHLDMNFAHGHTMAGAITGPQGEGLPGVSVLLTPTDSGRPAIGAITDAGGRYTLAGLAGGRYRLSATRHGLRTAPG